MFDKFFEINCRQFHKVSKDQFANAVKDKYENNYMSTDEFNSFLDKVYEDISLPKRATTGSAAYDFYSPYRFSLSPQEEILIPSGIKASMNYRDVLLFFPRSSLGFKYYARFANTIPVVDSDYYNNINNEGHIFIKIRNESIDKTMHIDKGEAFCQAMFINYLITNDDECEAERTGGIGSTNKKEI